jgi:alpha-galactosidase
MAVALFNRGTAPASMNLTAADAGLSRISTARDLWHGREVATDQLTFQVAPHGAVMLRVRGDD